MEQASRSSGKQETLQAERHVKGISEYAYQNGLSALTLRQLLDTVTLPNHLSRANSINVIKSLYPANKVSSELVCLVVGSLGYGKSKPAGFIQSLLLKWIVVVYEVLEDASILSKLYGVLFNMLDLLSLR